MLLWRGSGRSTRLFVRFPHHLPTSRRKHLGPRRAMRHQKQGGRPRPSCSRRRRLKLVLLPWTPIETLQQARELTLLGASCFALVAFGIAVRAGNGQVLLLAALFGGCAVGTYFDWRIASP